MKRLMISMLLQAAIIAAPAVGTAGEVAYEQVFSYREGILRFPDFTLKFIGTRPNGFYPNSTRRLGDVYEFRVVYGNSEQMVSWSEGTGAIGPAVFEVGGKCFWLELLATEKFGWMKEGEAVVSPAASSDCSR